jgi:hypothetical protein
MEGVKFMELPRINYHMMCADLKQSDLENFDRWLRGQVQSWFHMRGVPQGMAGMSWRDGGFTLPSLQDRQNTMVIRTICDIMTSKDPQIITMMKLFEEEQAHKYGMDIAESFSRRNRHTNMAWILLNGLFEMDGSESRLEALSSCQTVVNFSESVQGSSRVRHLCLHRRWESTPSPFPSFRGLRL